MYGWTGKVLRVNLTEGKCTTCDTDPKCIEAFIGGRGLGVKTYVDEVDSSTSPLSPENPLIFSAGPLAGTGAVCGSMCMVISKSPLTNSIVSGRMKGHFGCELKSAGYDMIVITGMSESPVYLSVVDDDVTLKPALEIWGKTTNETENIILSEFDDPWIAREHYIASIGPAGEAQVSISIITNEGHRVAPGAGLGAVMGSKNLKAIVIKGTKGTRIARDQPFIQVVSNILNRIRSKAITSQMLPRFGTPFLTKVLHEKGLLPVNNFQKSMFKHIDEVSGKALVSAFRIKNVGCFSCPIACVKFTELDSVAEGICPDYEALAALGPNLGVHDLRCIMEAYRISIDLGIDPVCAGSAIACAMELYERGYLSEGVTQQKLNFGNSGLTIQVLKEIGYTDGLSKLLGKGPSEVGKRFGHPECSMTVNGHALPPYDIRGIQGFGLHTATSNSPGDSLAGYTIIDEILGVYEACNPSDTDGKASKVKYFQDVSAAMDSIGVCIHLLMAVGIKQIFPMLKNAIGTDIKLDDMLLAGERVWNLERLANLKAGLTDAKDSLPDRILREPIREGSAEGSLLRIDETLPEYYRLRGWSEAGVPSPDKLAELGLE